MKNKRTDPNLPANIEDDMEILRNQAIKLYHRYKNQIMELDDLYQFLCETYLEAVQSYSKKPRIIPIRPFVFNYINFILMRTYRGQFKFENRYTFPVEEVLDPEEFVDTSDQPHIQRNPYLFENSYDLDRALSKYSLEDRIIIYYKWFLNKPTKDLHLYLPNTKKVAYIKVKQLKDKLKQDKDLLLLLKESLS